MSGSGSGPSSNVELPESAQRGQEVDTTVTPDGRVEFACPVCGRFIDANYIITWNECPGGHDLDLVLLQGDSAKRPDHAGP